ncbi:anti-sigma factor [Variovorax paradoxus]|jgi:anti-sigma-K factor RskA|uniref:anti-sigma factor n=1 Tax=Variovorax paradoxus TaxID=34073 RepID=UPI0029C8B5AD|nr:anti-sigma factor [Variovorax paradoxus]
MNIASNPRLLALLSAAYTLGTLGAGARRRFESLAREQAPVRVSALLWRERLASLVELSPAVEPPEAVWLRIRNLVDAELQRERAGARPAPPVPEERWWGSLALWRGVAAAGVVATLLAGVVGTHWWNEARGARPVQYVAILSDAGASPSMLVTFDPRSRQLTLQRVGTYQVAADRSLQLWALPPGRAPQSLGVLDVSARGMRLPADAASLQQAPALAISLEPKGGVPGDRGPTGPVLFSGPLVEKTL